MTKLYKKKPRKNLHCPNGNFSAPTAKRFVRINKNKTIKLCNMRNSGILAAVAHIINN